MNDTELAGAMVEVLLRHALNEGDEGESPVVTLERICQERDALRSRCDALEAQAGAMRRLLEKDVRRTRTTLGGMSSGSFEHPYLVKHLAALVAALSPDAGRAFAERLERAERVLREVAADVDTDAGPGCSHADAARAALAPEAGKLQKADALRARILERRGGEPLDDSATADTKGQDEAGKEGAK